MFQQGGRGEGSVDWTSRRSKNLLEGDARSETEAVSSHSSSTTALIPLPVTRYPLPVTRYPLPVTRYPLPVTAAQQPPMSRINC